ncbi:3-isopropylmalate dehydratase small subunit [Pseudonocardia sp. TRM90224]|uniref:3-isopropylmalate dehydratase small subunit n=1 Tax=Pseudonocardia sp. TRM90224 TaxID=2812678 RepID=UPI002104E06E
MRPFTVHTGTAAPLRRSNVDTDQIIPARFCVRSTRSGHADSLFADWRDDPGFVLNRPGHRGATVLVAGNDFGIGSSREYAVWALQDYGFRAVIAPRYGDIFRENSLLNGLLTVTVPIEAVEEIWAAVEADPAEPVTVDLERLQVRCAGNVTAFDLDPDVRERLLHGLDAIAMTLREEELIVRYEASRHPALPTTR